MTITPNDLICFGCGKRPHEIEEYVEMWIEDQDSYASPADAVMKEEGTLNWKTGRFACTECYIAADMPTEPYPKRWVAP